LEGAFMPNKQISKKIVFKNFNEYWHFARHLSQKQRELVFKSLPKDQQRFINKSLTEGKWEDVFFRNAINDLLDDLKKDSGFNLLEIKCKVLKGRSVYLPKKFWDIATEQLGKFKPNHTQFILGGIKAIECKQNKEVVLIVPASSESKE